MKNSRHFEKRNGMKIYISFGQSHIHEVNGIRFDKNCLAEIKCESHHQGREIAFNHFGPRFFTSYEESQIADILPYFPRGIVALN